MFSLIVAHDENFAIGYKGKIPWHLKEDLKEFKKHTIGKRILMGRVTFESIGKPLPDRHTIVVSSIVKEDSENVSYINDLHNFLKENKDSEEEIMICGGAHIYEECLPYCKKMYISLVSGKHLADTYFPKYDVSDYEILSKKTFEGFVLIEYLKKSLML